MGRSIQILLFRSLEIARKTLLVYCAIIPHRSDVDLKGKEE